MINKANPVSILQLVIKNIFKNPLFLIIIISVVYFQLLRDLQLFLEPLNFYLCL